jgi:signal transduction histidine kinase
MVKRWLLRLAIVACVSLVWLRPAGAEAPSHIQVIDSADITLESHDKLTRSSQATLPLHWDIAMPGQQGQAQIRMRFEVPVQAASGPWAALIPRLGNAWHIELNGKLIQENGPLDAYDDGWAAKKPVWVSMPIALLQSSNELVVTLRADRGRHAGMSRLTVGPASELLPLWTRQEWLRIVLPQSGSVLSLMVAVFCLLLWWQQRDPLYAIAAVGELVWGIRLADTWWEASPLPWPMWAMTVVILFGIWSAANYLLVREVWGGRPAGEQTTAMGVIVMGLICFFVALWNLNPLWIVGWTGVSLIFWLVLEARLAWEAWRQPTLPRWLVVTALISCTLAVLRDVYASRANAMLFDESAWSKYTAMTMAISILIIVSIRFKRAREELLDLNRTMHDRITQRELELTTQHQQIQALESERATSEERTRILRDMHDGAGAHLIAAIHQVESGQASSTELLETLRESLDQLRLNIDAMHLPPGDINALVSSLRFRLERRIQAAGLRLIWRADELPLIGHYQSAQLRHVQFIVLEAISNAIQHAHGTHLTVTATADATHVVLELKDDGVGTGNGTGNGLRSMQERAALIGAQLQRLAGEPGTRVVLKLPLRQSV